VHGAGSQRPGPIGWCRGGPGTGGDVGGRSRTGRRPAVSGPVVCGRLREVAGLQLRMSASEGDGGGRRRRWRKKAG
jgi:hypothetical protein